MNAGAVRLSKKRPSVPGGRGRKSGCHIITFQFRSRQNHYLPSGTLRRLPCARIHDKTQTGSWTAAHRDGACRGVPARCDCLCFYTGKSHPGSEPPAQGRVGLDNGRYRYLRAPGGEGRTASCPDPGSWPGSEATDLDDFFLAPARDGQGGEGVSGIWRPVRRLRGGPQPRTDNMIPKKAEEPELDAGDPMLLAAAAHPPRIRDSDRSSNKFPESFGVTFGNLALHLARFAESFPAARPSPIGPAALRVPSQCVIIDPRVTKIPPDLQTKGGRSLSGGVSAWISIFFSPPRCHARVVADSSVVPCPATLSWIMCLRGEGA